MGAFNLEMFLWPGAVVPYAPRPEHPFWKQILKAINEINRKTCVCFVERRHNQTPFIRFTSGLGGTFYNRTDHIVNIDHDAPVLHELLHVLGMIHEHQRADRDAHIVVVRNHLLDNAFTRSQILDKVPATIVSPYDVKSCMHYWATAGSLDNRFVTLTDRARPDKPLKTRNRLSPHDISSIDTMYNTESKNIQWQNVVQVYLIRRAKQSLLKSFIGPRKSRKQQLRSLQNILASGTATEFAIMIMLGINAEKRHLLGPSTLFAMCQDVENM